MKKFTIKEISHYDIINMNGCPIKLPSAKSMTQARIDYNFLKPAIKSWFLNNVPLRKRIFYKIID